MPTPDSPPRAPEQNAFSSRNYQYPSRALTVLILLVIGSVLAAWKLLQRGGIFFTLTNLVLLFLFVFWAAVALRHAKRQRLAAEKAESEHEEKYRALFNSIDEGFCIIEMIFENARPVDYRFLEINQAFEAQTGIMNAQGKRMREIAETHEEHWFQIYGKVAMTGEPIRFENRAEQLNRSYDVYAFRIGKPEEHKVAILFSDITKRKETELALLLKTEELAHSKAELEQLEIFTFVASHDMQEPLHKITAFSDLLKRQAGDSLNEKARASLSRIEGAAERMRGLIERVRDLANFGKEQILLEPLNMEDLVREVLTDLELRVQQSGAHIQIGKLPAIYADKSQVREIFHNLISNALKFRKTGQEPHIKIQGRELGGGWAELTVEDDGLGFDEKYLPQLFKPFKRLHRKEDYEGLGLGLTICHKIVLRNHGRITARSTPGKGSVFTVTLPQKSLEIRK